MSAGLEFIRSVIAKHGLLRMVGTLWCDLKPKLVSFHQFGGSPYPELVCAVLQGNNKAVWKRGQGRGPVSSQGVVAIRDGDVVGWGPKVLF